MQGRKPTTTTAVQLWRPRYYSAMIAVVLVVFISTMMTSARVNLYNYDESHVRGGMRRLLQQLGGNSQIYSRFEYGIRDTKDNNIDALNWVHNGSYEWTHDTETFPVGVDIPMEELEHVSVVEGDSSLEFQPDQVHVSVWTSEDVSTSMLVSFATGIGRTGNAKALHVTPYDVDMCGDSVVKYRDYIGAMRNNNHQRSMVSSRWRTVVTPNNNNNGNSSRVVYSYAYRSNSAGEESQGEQRTQYHSPIFHHVVVSGLRAGREYEYRVGTTRCGMSPKTYTMKIPRRGNVYPMTVGVVSDLGQSPTSALTLERLMLQNKEKATPDVVILAGDLSYADAYYPNGSFYYWNDTNPLDYFRSYQPRWDTFGRLLERSGLSRIPFHTIGGNHELESLTLQENITNLAYNARFPNPQFPHSVKTNPNDPSLYWDMTQLPNTGIFGSSRDIVDNVITNNTFYSIDIGPAHIIFLNNYVPYSNTSVMYKWLQDDLESVVRSLTAFVVVVFHTPWYSSYHGSYKENSEMQLFIEPLLYKHNVDLVINGHVHAYERSTPVYNNRVDPCGPVHITLGSGTAEGLTQGFIDNLNSTTYRGVSIKEFCRYPSKYYSPPAYQPTYSGRGYIDQNVWCFDSQAPWSDYREPSFGHGEIVFINDTAMEWRWNRNVDPDDSYLDRVLIIKSNTNENGSECDASKVVAGISPSAHSSAKQIPYVIDSIV
jgi:hypothetical protein